MQKEISKQKATRLINCGMLVLITAGYKDKTTITPCAWHLPLSKTPPSVGIALAKKHFSSELIRKSEEFIVNIPDWRLLKQVITCGSFSGRDKDKFKETGLTSQKANRLVKTPKIKECIGSLECYMVSLKEVGDHFLFIGEIIYAEAEEKYFINDLWDTSRLKLIFHIGSRYFFPSSSSVEVK